ncbi:PKD domain-containing protein [Kosakonia radicincitans]|uniref:PKD domain-containing protein n=1 Tax=Kosakonia radicincitans TaxID=283686 RepID=UPI0005C31A21|nr:carbohydrate-binding protein [Kosakonia radicincitans]KIS41277.1 carbohydrate binding domain protein [Kosakonia radicincitans YD4]
MKIKSLALLICAVLPSFSALAENIPVIQIAWKGNTYPAIMVKMKAAPGLTRQQLPALLTLDDPSLSVNAAFKHATARGTEISELQALDAKYGFDRYLRIAIPDERKRDIAYINGIVEALKQNANVEVVYPEAELVPHDAVKTGRTAKQLKVIDYRSLQYYTKGPNDSSPSYSLGGVNRDSVNQFEGHDGSNVTILSHELGMWNQNHINLPKAAFILGTPNSNQAMTDHDTASVGIMAATDIGAGVKGLAWNTRMAYAAAGSDQLYNAIPRLQAGDVVQIGFEISGGQQAGCADVCALPLESQQAYFDVLKALTDKGVHVIEAAANGNVDLDNSAFGGLFDLKKRDSGAILAGAINPVDSMRASFSNYGSRVTSASWGLYVTSTGYGDLARPNANETYTWQFSGTSSANPIIAGAVASLSSIAKAHGKTVTPRQMRDIIHDTGTSLASTTSTLIGTQPDMGRAVEKILELDGEVISGEAPVISVDRATINTVATSTSWSYPVTASSDQANVSWEWKFISGDSSIRLSNTSSDSTTIIVPANVGNTQARFQVTATNGSGKSSTTDVTIVVTQPTVVIVGVDSMDTNSPARMFAQANFEQASYAWQLLKDGQPVTGGIDQNGQIKAGLPAGNYVAEVTATNTTQGTRTATTRHSISVTGEAVQNNDAAFIQALQMAISATDNERSVTFNGNVTSTQAATSTPTYSWVLPAGAQGSSDGLPSQRFTINKTSQPQTLTVNVTVNAGTESRVLTQTLTVPALTSNGGENDKAPLLNVDRRIINTVASNVAWSYPIVASSDQANVAWEWKFISGNSNIRLSGSTSDRTFISVPANAGNTQARFQVTATNSNGKATSTEVSIVVAQPVVVIAGVKSMDTASPVKLYTQANFEQAGYAWRLLKDGQVVSNGIDQNGQIQSGLTAGDYVAEVTATNTAQGIRTATATHAIKVTGETVQNNDAAFIKALQMAFSTTDNGDSVTFNGFVTSSTVATSAPTYNWSLPAGAQGGSNNLASQRFTIAKTSQPQTLAVNVTVKAGSESRVLTKTITVPAKEVPNTDAAFINALQMALSSTDNGNSVTFSGNVTSAQAATSAPTYSWSLPAGAQGGSNGLASQRFTIAKTSQPQTLAVNVTVKAGTQSRVLTKTITVPAKEVTNTDAAFINALQMALSSTDNGNNVTFSGNVTSAQAATSAPTYSWSLPAGAQGGSNGLASQRFTIAKTSQPQTLAVNVTVKAGTQSRVLTKSITVAALANNDDGGYPQWAFGTAYKAGDVVTHKGKNFECVVAGWCSQAGEFSQLHYEPGVGLNWSMAWKKHN